MTSPDDELPSEDGWDMAPATTPARLDLPSELLERKADYKINMEILGRLGFTARPPSFDQVNGVIASLGADAKAFLRTHSDCKPPTSIIVPSSLFGHEQDTSTYFSIGLIAELDLLFEGRQLNQIYSTISKVLDVNGLRFLHANEWRVLHEMRKAYGVGAMPGGTYFPLFSCAPGSPEQIPMVSVIGETQRFLRFPGKKSVPSNIIYYAAAMADVSF